MTMEKVDGRWLASKVELPSTDAPAAYSGAPGSLGHPIEVPAEHGLDVAAIPASFRNRSAAVNVGRRRS